MKIHSNEEAQRQFELLEDKALQMVSANDRCRKRKRLYSCCKCDLYATCNKLLAYNKNSQKQRRLVENYDIMVGHTLKAEKG